MPSSFQDRWLTDPTYKLWIKKVSSGFAHCKLCKSDIALGSMGKTAIDSHAKGKAHKALVKAAEETTRVNFSVPNTSADTRAQPVRSVLVADHVTREANLASEITWTLKMAHSNLSFHSSEGISRIFQQMFPDSAMAEKFALGETKSMYLMCFGLGPFCRRLVEQAVRQSSEYVLLFDESLNENLQKKQLDFHVRFWQDNRVVTKYYTSEFMGHAKTSDLFQATADAVLQQLPLNNVIQLSMDGPTVNHAFYKQLDSKLKNDHGMQLINLGSCGLHTIHNSFQKGMDAAGWKIKDFLKAIYTVFHDTPARREDFENITGKSLYALKFCAHRWVENARVAVRAVEMLPSLKAYVTAVKNNAAPNPNTKSYEIIAEMITDPLLKAKLAAFTSVAELFNSFLVVYQTDAPMVPFLAQDLETLIRNVMKRCIKPSVLEEASTASKLLDIKLNTDEVFLIHKKIDSGFVSEGELSRLFAEKKIRERHILEFHLEFKAMVTKALMHMIEKSPLKYSMVR